MKALCSLMCAVVSFGMLAVAVPGHGSGDDDRQFMQLVGKVQLIVPCPPELSWLCGGD